MARFTLPTLRFCRWRRSSTPCAAACLSTRLNFLHPLQDFSLRAERQRVLVGFRAGESWHVPVSQRAGSRGQLKKAHVNPTIATPVCPPDSLRFSPSNAFGPSFGTDFSLPGAKTVYAPAARARRSTRTAPNVDGAALAAGAEGAAAAAFALTADGALEPLAAALAGDLAEAEVEA